ncbi:MAG TPA: response regulator [Mesorhizobium sp.]|jgi:two-component system chemotaxis response regulator CheY|nr:response regulator [Mesorhizobium sp.]
MRCLFVDDSGVIRKVARRILSGAGLDVIEAGLGSEALGFCAAEMPDIVVLDGFLPDMDTVEVIRHIRAMPAGGHPRIVICLVEKDVGSIMRAKRAGAQGYLLKPFDRLSLLSRMQEFSAAAA